MSLREAAETAITQCLAVGPDESCTVVTDDERRPIGEALYEAARAVGADAVLVQYPPGEQHGEEPPRPVAAAMRETDVYVAPTTKSLSHTDARRAATAAGVRGATMPEITESVMVEGLAADYDAIARHCRAVLDQVADAETYRVTTPAGTDLTLERGDRAWLDDTGIVHDPGDFSNLPAGEVFVSPTSGDGRVVVDGTMSGQGRVDEPVVFTVEAGQVVDIEDDQLRGEVETAAAEVGDAAYNLAELGIGTNVGVTALVGSVLLDEKVAGTVHVAIGDDAGIGGDVVAPIHADGIMLEPTVTADGEPVDLPRP